MCPFFLCLGDLHRGHTLRMTMTCCRPLLDGLAFLGSTVTQKSVGQHYMDITTDNPAMVGQPFPTDLLGTAAFAHRVDQLDPIGVDDAEHGRSRQEDLRPVLMRLQKTKEP